MKRPTDKALDCPFCAHGDVTPVALEHDAMVMAVTCPKCGALGPVSLSDDPAQAVFAWNQRVRRMSLVK